MKTILNSQIKRMFFVMLVAGLSLSLISMAHWSFDKTKNKLFFVKNVYKWVKVDQRDFKNGQSLWVLDKECATPYIDNHIQEHRNKLEEHILAEPKKPEEYHIAKEFTQKAEKDVAQRLLRTIKQTKLTEAHTAWKSKLWILELSLKRAKTSIPPKAYKGIKESELLERLNFQESIVSKASELKVLGAATHIKKINKENKTVDILISELGLRGFSEHNKENLMKRCVNELYLSKKIIKREFKTNITAWFKQSKPTSYIGIFFLLIGLIGAFFGSIVTKAYLATVGKILAWIRYG